MTGMPPGWCWRTSSFSSANNDCVAIGYSESTGEPGAIGDSKNPGGPVITATTGAIRALLVRVSAQQ